jgi:hypoxanthine phosphoribosyltransferase
MENLIILENKKVLIVDDEQDVLETMADLLDMCQIDTAPDFETMVGSIWMIKINLTN